MGLLLSSAQADAVGSWASTQHGHKRCRQGWQHAGNRNIRTFYLFEKLRSKFDGIPALRIHDEGSA